MLAGKIINFLQGAIVTVLSKAKRFVTSVLTVPKATVCGHDVRKGDHVVVDGFKYGLDASLFAGGKRPYYCIPCLRKKSIYCAWCGKEILVGTQVSLQEAVDGFEHKRDKPISVYKGAGSTDYLIGCLREKCVHGTPLMVGTWSKTGEVTEIGRAISVTTFQS